MFETLPKSALDAMDWKFEQYKPYIDDLLTRPLTAENVDAWLLDWSSVVEVVSEVGSRLRIATTQDTTNKDAEARFLAFVRDVSPPLQVENQKLKQKLLATGLEPKGFEIPLRNMRVQAEIFREENVPLFTQEQEIGLEFDKAMGAQTVEWEGKEIPLQQLQPVGLNPDRSIRERAWRLAHSRFLADREKINELWVKFLELRQKMAANAGFKTFTEYQFKQMERFDYTPEDCMKFHKAIEEVVMPAMERLFERRRRQMGVDKLRPWDLNCDPTHNNTIAYDPRNRPTLKPYQSVQEMEAKAASVFKNVDPALGEHFATMQRENLLDLGSRMGKAPGGYCSGFAVLRRPFIFMNSVGVHDDVQTLLHEAGHAFHVFESAGQPYIQQRDYPIEFAEVASMAMELLAAPYLTQKHGGYYSEADAARARTEHLESMLSFWPYMAVVDAFQHWVYANIEDAKNPANCDAKWAELWGRYIRGVDWSDLEQEMMTGWHRKLHIHQIPFYYVEYGLAQLGAAQVWRGALTNQAEAVKRYRQALALGGTASLPRLYETAGARFAFDAETLRGAVELIEKTVTELSAAN